MKNNIKSKYYIFLLIILSAFISACAVQQPAPRVTNRVAPTQTIPNAILNQITIEDLRVTCDLMARDLIVQEFIYKNKNSPIIAVKPIENKTDLTIDPDIFQKTIRVKLMKYSGGRILFRDDASYQYTLQERMKQSGGKVQITSTTTQARRQNSLRVGQPLNVQAQETTDTTMTDDAAVEKKVADVDYFLTGLIFLGLASALHNMYCTVQFI